jgi:hypothetical protein
MVGVGGNDIVSGNGGGNANEDEKHDELRKIGRIPMRYPFSEPCK